MKLWMLKRIGDLPKSVDPWVVNFDHDSRPVEVIVVEARLERYAREAASECHGDEGKDVWLDEELTSIEELVPTGVERAIAVCGFRDLPEQK